MTASLHELPAPQAATTPHPSSAERAAVILTAIGYLPEDAAWFVADPDSVPAVSALEAAMAAAGRLAFLKASLP